MAIQTEQSQVITTATTTTMAALGPPTYAVQPGTLCYVYATSQIFSYQPQSTAAADYAHIASSYGGVWQLEPQMGNWQASARSFVEMPYGDPSLMAAGTILTTATINTCKFTAQNGGPVANIVMYTTTAAATLTAATTLTASAAAAGTTAQSALGQVVLTTGSTASFATNDIVVVTGLVGTTEGNGTWQITVVDSTHVALIGSVFVNTYVSGGTVTRSVNCCALYSAAGTWLGATPDQVGSTSLWTASAPALQTMAVVNTANPSLLTLQQGAVYYMVVVTKATTPPIFMGPPATTAECNLNLTAAGLIYGTLSTAATKLTSTITPANIVVTDAEPMWFALS
jgi:hypothetical protein